MRRERMLKKKKKEDLNPTDRQFLFSIQTHAWFQVSAGKLSLNGSSANHDSFLLWIIWSRGHSGRVSPVQSQGFESESKKKQGVWVQYKLCPEGQMSSQSV